MLIYLCILDEADIDTQGVCNSAATGESVDQCTSGQLIAGWAVGGEVNHFNNISVNLH